MWLCVLQLLLLLTTSKWTWATPEEAYEPVSADLEDPKDGSMILFLEGRSLFGNDHLKSDIEARRRSTFEKNFMRFGRSKSVPRRNDDITEDEEFADDLDRAARSSTKNDNFIRFGRSHGGGEDIAEDMDRPPRSSSKNDNFVRFGRGSDFIRFGRDPYKYARRSNPEKDSNFIRFQHKRSRRSIDAMEPQDEDAKFSNKRSSNIVRFGRNDNFMRFGRGGEGLGDLTQEVNGEDTNAGGKFNDRRSLVAFLRLQHYIYEFLKKVGAKAKSEKPN